MLSFEKKMRSIIFWSGKIIWLFYDILQLFYSNTLYKSLYKAGNTQLRGLGVIR
jgi:hypothetical protein